MTIDVQFLRNGARRTDRRTEKMTHRGGWPTSKCQTDERMDGWTDRQTDRHTDKRSNKKTIINHSVLLKRI